MARFPLNVADGSRYRSLVDDGLMPLALRLPTMSKKQSVSFVCSTSARGLLPELVRIASESAAVDARAAHALAEEDPAAAETFRDEADFWTTFGARHPNPRGRWRRGDQGLTPRARANELRSAKMPVTTSPLETNVAVPVENVEPGPKNNEAPTQKRTGQARPTRSPGVSGGTGSPERSVRDLPAWALDILEALPPLVTRASAAKTLGVSEKTLDRRIDEGALVVVPVGSRVLIPRLELVGYLVRQSR